MRLRALLSALVFALLSTTSARVDAARLSSVSVLDKDYVVVHVLDGEVIHNEGAPETVNRFTPELNLTAATQHASWTIKSSQDAAYGGAGRNPVACQRKKKLSGHGQMEWSGSDYRYEYTYQHWIYLRLPSPLQQGMSYTLEIASATNSDRSSASFTFDVFNTRSEAVHVNLVGYAPDAPHKAADLYHWLGDGGARDYSSFEGNTVYVYDVATARAYPVGQVTFWSPGGEDSGWYNLTRSPVWNADFSGFADSGTYRLAIEGVGCSQDFRIGSDAYRDAFKVSLRGYYYMRLGQDNPTGLTPPPRTPLYIPGVSPATTRVYLTTMQPWHSQWSSFASGDPWDQPDSWAPYRKAGNPTNPNAWGGHSDAFDWDRHLGHVSIIYDMLLPYILTGGAIRDDDTGITESGNGIPDLLDEARNEVDFWLRLRDGEGYAHGLTNPNGSNELFQAGATPMAAWANAANAAMLADAFRIAGLSSLMADYRDAAVTAYNYANRLANPMLDATQNIGEGSIRGRDLKMTAAAFLYNVTGDPAYEAVVNQESVCTSAVAELEDGTRNQVWATAGYLMTPRSVNYPALQANMRSSVINEAETKEAGLVDTRPSRRATDNRTGYFRTIQNVQRTLIAHAVTGSQSEKDFFRKALDLEAAWGLGRNPLNIIEMGTATTPLAGKRSIQGMYTTGRDDGVPGLHPGHTPYLNLDDWWAGMVMGTPSRLYENGYPADFKNTWPVAEGYFNSPWVWAHSEFTPQQTMRGKTALYAYLHGLAGTADPPPPTPTLTVTTAGSGSGTVTSSPAGIACGSDCSETYASGTSVTLTASAAAGSTFAGWGGACSGSGACSVTMDSAKSVTAAFESVGSTSPTYGNNGLSWGISASGTTRIQAENYDTGGEGAAYHDNEPGNNGGQYRTDAVDIESTSDTGGGHNVGWIVNGEWLEYTVDVAAAGTYDIRLRVAREPAGDVALRVSFAGVDRTGSLVVPSTGGWQTWTDVTKTGITLAAGPQRLRIAMEGTDFNLNWIEISGGTSTPGALTVVKSGTGSGTVTSAPAGIACGSDCSESFGSGTRVALTATPAAGSAFAGWGGGTCSGTGTCTLTTSGAQAVTAVFDTLTASRTYGNNGLPWAVGSIQTTRIQAENYDVGGEGVAYHDSDAANRGGAYRDDGVDVESTTDKDDGHDVGWVVAGEWLEYTIGVAAPGTYDLKLRVSRKPRDSAAVRVLFGGVDKTGEIAIPSTGNWQKWADVVHTGVTLSAGVQVMRLDLRISDFNLNWIELIPISTTPVLSVSKSGTGGGTVTSSPAGISCGSDCSEAYAAGTSVTLTAAPATGSVFGGWGGACAGTGACTVTASGAQSVTATFTASTTPTLTVTKSGAGSGTVTSAPAGIVCGSDCSETYASGTGVVLNASPIAGSTFAGWTGACSGTGSCSVTMSTAQSVVATFNLLPVRGSYGNNGLPWTINASGTTRIQAENYDSGGEGLGYHDSDASNGGGQYRTDGVDIEGTSDTGGGYDVGWIVPGEWLEYSVNVAAAGTYDVKLRLARLPSGSSEASVSFGGVDKTGAMAVPSTGGWQSWTDVTMSGVTLAAGRQVLRIAMRGGDFNLNWIEITGISALSVSSSGSGSGRVTSAPAGIDCGSDCSEIFTPGTTVTLTASPAAGSAFAGWGGACSAAGPTCTLAMNGAQAVTAAFDTTTTIYGDTIAADWQSWSWGSTIDFGATAPVKSGTNAINVTYTEGWGGLSLRKATALPTSGYAALKFWVHGGTGADKLLGVTTHAEDTGGESARVLVTAVANTWTEITVPLSGLGYPAVIKRVTVMNFTPDPQTQVTFDDIRLEAVSGPLSQLAVGRNGAGFGSVTSWPPGISCGSDCSEGFSPDTTVTLTPSAAAGSMFAGWGGACTGTGACTVPMNTAQSVTATFNGSTVPGGVRWVGRVDASNPSAVRFAWQGAGFVAVVNGPTVSVKLQTTGAPAAFYQVVVDGLPSGRFGVPESAIQTVPLVGGLADGPHVIELYRETEGMYGVSTFWGFAEGTVVGSPATNRRLIEVVGDAISAGYGNLGSEPHPNWVANPACTWSADNSSWYATYAAVAGRALGAEVSTVARSGWGLVRDGSGNTANILPSVYPNAVGTGDTTPWGYQPEPSVVVINLGTSDMSLGDPGTAYETAYVDFVRQLRGRYPNAWIFLTIGSVLRDASLATINTRLANVVATVNDSRVVTFDLGMQDFGWDGSVPTGCDWHPSAADHARMSEILKTQLRTRLGW